ncbi:MAG: DsbE family thiol:disulfide interchange protein [Rhodospirillales bacterium]|nr:DsbE family thiol:disulfide interchange protein [Rhodospirillales bacterium]
MRKSTKSILFLLPTLIFMAAAAVFFLGLDPKRDPTAIPSPLIDRAAPAVTLPPLPGLDLPGIDPDLLKGSPVTVVNLWASWCAPCRIEHPQLMALSEDPDVRMLGIDYRDRADKGLAMLQELGNPFDAVGFDPQGRAAIDWGITGVPETFFLDSDGRVRFRHRGPIDERLLEKIIRPKLEEIAG